MKASDAALATTSAFLRQDVKDAADKLRIRQPLDALAVPQNDDGLRVLAANGDWASVVALADKLEDEAASQAHSFVLKRDPGDPLSGGNREMKISSSMAALMARLPYVLVQVSAYFKMQRVGAAKKLIDTLGDLEGEGFLYPGSQENFAPFSLRFLAALMPFYLGAPMEAQRKLYVLLAECAQRRVRTVGAPDSSLWLHRESRIRRALAYLHVTAGQHAMAIQHMTKLMDAADETEGLRRPDTSALTCAQRVRRVLLLQQLACLCLHCGSLVLAERAFAQIDVVSATAGSTASEKEKMVMSHVMRVNEAFMLTFCGRFAEAAEEFREIAASAKDNRGDALALSRSGSSETTHLLDAILAQVQANAQTSEAACMPYCQSRSDPHTAIANLIEATEERLRANPKVLASSDPFVADLVRLYTLAGDRKLHLDRLASVLEVFRCDAASLPNLEKLV